jgi:SAM-dependent methyltransferase
MRCDAFALQDVRESRLLIDQCDTWLVDQVKPYIGQRVLEVGCGLGNLTMHLLDCELVIGIDISESSVDNINSSYAHQDNVQAVQCDVTKPKFLELKSYLFDTALSLNVLEHIEDDILALRNMYEVLVKNGQLILIVPAHPFLFGTMDQAIGHYRRYTAHDLKRKLIEVGFDVCAQKYINPIGAVGWYLNGRFLRRKVPPVGQLKLFNRLMPFVVLVESHITIPFGLSLLSISRRID